METLVRVFDRLRVFNRRLNIIDQRLRALENPVSDPIPFPWKGNVVPGHLEPQHVGVVRSLNMDPADTHAAPLTATSLAFINNRYRLVSDDSCHYYLIPADKQLAWWEWMESQEARDGVEPDWAKRIDGYTRFTFTDPQEDP